MKQWPAIVALGGGATQIFLDSNKHAVTTSKHNKCIGNNNLLALVRDLGWLEH